jgi:aspartyl-tRNA(Asn)/glutamyl-tRNA(Gln) amidotransferase subunit A
VTIDELNLFLHLDPQEGTGGPRIGVKDVIDVAGMPTTAASRILHRVPDEDAECVARLRAEGATIVGKVNTHEFAYGALTTSPHFGPARNPWNPEHVCGGSSGGSAGAVAAGLVDAALGTDTAGSVRIPACFCGVTGMRPSTGLVSNRGVVPVSWSLDAVGTLARTAEECERLLEAIADRPLGGGESGDELRVGVVTSLFERAEPAVAAVCEQALADLPGRHEPVAMPLHEEISTVTQLLMLPEATTAHLHWLRTRLDDYGDDVRARLLAGLMLPPTAHVTGLRARSWVRSEWERELGEYDLLAAPEMPITAPRLDAIPEDYRLLIMPFNSPAALLGVPALSIPCGFVDGLPVGLALTGRRGEDGTPLAAAKVFQRETDWHERRPPISFDGVEQAAYTASTFQQKGE